MKTGRCNSDVNFALTEGLLMTIVLPVLSVSGSEYGRRT